MCIVPAMVRRVEPLMILKNMENNQAVLPRKIGKRMIYIMHGTL